MQSAIGYSIFEPQFSRFTTNMDILANLRAFQSTTRHGSFSEAGRQLHVVPSVIAKRIGELEHATGTQLFNRSTRKVTLTAEGQKFQPKAAALVSDFDEVIAGLRSSEGMLEGHIRLKAPTTLTMLYLAEVLNAFQREHERVTMEVVLMDRSVNPVEEGFDLVIGGHSASYEGVIDIPLCRLGQVVCASPSYLEKRGRPLPPRGRADHDCLVFTPTGPTWFFDSERGPISIDVPQKLAANDNHLLFGAARHGNGIALLPIYVVREALQNGSLVAMLNEY